jgi:hypothetical protein
LSFREVYTQLEACGSEAVGKIYARQGAGEKVYGVKPGEKGQDQSSPGEWAVRSFARAKQCFADVGDAEEAAQAYVKEQDARRFKAHKNKDAIQFVTLTLWRWTSLYGQSWRRWLACMVGLLLVFAGVYEWQFRIGLLELPEGSHWITFITGLYHAAATVLTLGFDEIRPVGAVSQLAVLLNLALA